MSAKQDRTGARTAADLERKYKFNWGKSFAEVLGIATDARTKAEVVEEEIKKLEENFTADEIFNRLTNNGQIQGLFKEGDNIYINAEYIKAIEKLFANDITMTGKFTNEVEVFLEPGEEEVETIRQHILGTNVLPAALQTLYDANGDGEISVLDLADFRQAQMGVISLKDRAFARKTKLTLTIDLKNPEKFIQYTGTNMWSRNISGYIGIYTSSHIQKEKSRLKKVLYNGKWSTGTAIIPNADQYTLFMITMEGIGTTILATRHGDFVRGIGGYTSDTPSVTTYHFSANVSGDEWTLVACNEGKPFSDNGYTARTVTSVVGII